MADEKYGTRTGVTDEKTTAEHHDKVHPVGSGVGAAAGAATGAAVGTAVGGPAGTLVYTTISQGSGSSQVVAACETAADAASVSIPPAVLGLFSNGAFTVTMSHQTQAFATSNGYNITFLLTGP
ncbi:hypothetical protein EHM82_00120, partial [bacterium]